MSGLRIAVLAGGVGGGRFLKALSEYQRSEPGAISEITGIVNTADDMWFDGLRISPDVDSIIYTVAGVNDETRGWGRRGDTERVHRELVEYGLGRPWFTLGDLDIATSIARTHWLRKGASLTDATARLAARWKLPLRLLPMSDDFIETHVVLRDGDQTRLHFQEWWVRYRASLAVRSFEQVGQEQARMTPEVGQALEESDVILIAPSNPVVSIATVLGVPGCRDVIASANAPVVGVSPIIGNAVVRGKADVCLEAIGVETSAAAVADWYGARAQGGLLDGWVVDPIDSESSRELAVSGIAVASVPLMLDTPEKRQAIVRSVLALSGRL